MAFSLENFQKIVIGESSCFQNWSPSTENLLNFRKKSNGMEIPGQKVSKFGYTFSSGIS